MLKVLIKKELLQLNQFYFYNRKTKKIRSKKGIVVTILLFLMLFLFLGVSFGFMNYNMAKSFVSMNLDWLYFSMICLTSLVLGIFGDVFNTYTLLYKSKDNDLLLSMPISPSKLLASRVLGVYLMGQLYSGLVFVPSVVVYWIVKPATVATVICPLVVWFVSGILISALTCVLGWVVAAISAKLTNKNFTKVLATLAFLAVYYLVYFKVVNALQNISLYVDSIAKTVSGWMFLSFHMGMGAVGNIGSLLIFVGIVFALFVLVYFLMSRSYIKMTTTIRGSKKIEYRKKTVKSNSLMGALVKKELRRFSSSSTCMMNLGIGLVLSVVAAIFVLVKADTIREVLPLIAQLAENASWVSNAIVVAAAVMPMTLISTNTISAPSLSLEGKCLWILQSCPVDGRAVFKAKILNHIILSSVPTLFISIAICWVLELGFVCSILVVLFDFLFMIFVDVAGLWVDSKKYNFNWTNEVYIVKQGFSVGVMILGGWGLMVAVGGLFFLLRYVFNAAGFLSLIVVVFAALIYLMYRNLMRTGREEFAFLS